MTRIISKFLIFLAFSTFLGGVFAWFLYPSFARAEKMAKKNELEIETLLEEVDVLNFSDEALIEFDIFMTKAELAISDGDYKKAKKALKEARKKLKQVENLIEDSDGEDDEENEEEVDDEDDDDEDEDEDNEDENDDEDEDHELRHKKEHEKHREKHEKHEDEHEDEDEDEDEDDPVESLRFHGAGDDDEGIQHSGRINTGHLDHGKGSKKRRESQTASVLSAVSTTASPDGYYTRPLPDGVGRRSQGRHGRNAVDLAAPGGTPILAAAAGTVVFSGRNGGYGNLILIKHDNGTTTAYAHNSRNLVEEGDSVAQGETIGLVGSTGKSTGPHVHFEVRGAKNPF